MRTDCRLLSASDRHRIATGVMPLVTRRAARNALVAASLAAGMVGLAAGLVVGRQWPQPDVDGLRAADGAHRAHVIGELGRMDAGMAQLQPRLERLARRIEDLRPLQARPAPTGDVDGPRPAQAAAGGPALPALTCPGARRRWPAHRPELAEVGGRLACMSDTLGQLEEALGPWTLMLATTPGRPPVADIRVESSFGNRIDPFDHLLRFHSGVDYPAPTGTAVLATAGGSVTFAGQKPGYGRVVEIDHGRGLVTRYAHLSRIHVREGEVVEPLAPIADIGSTGRSTGPHLHFEVLDQGRFVNPAGYLSLFAAAGIAGD